MSKLIAMVTTDQGVPFNVVLISEGDKYGLDNCLTHEESRPLIEFYDARYRHSEYGQFVSRYYLETLLEGDQTTGLCLEGSVSEWNVDSLAMAVVNRALSAV